MKSDGITEESVPIPYHQKEINGWESSKSSAVVPEKPAPSTEGRWAAAGFVWGTWALMVILALGFINNYGLLAPYIDDWEYVPYVTGAAPVTTTYLWEQHNEHRIPLPKLILLALLKLTRFDLHSGMYFQAVVLAGMAFAMIWVARKLRGWTSYTDAVIPVLLLSWGRCEELIWSWEVSFTLPALLISVAFLILIRRQQLTFRAAVALGVCLILLPLCGAPGLPFVVLLGLWLGWLGVRAWRSEGKPREGLVLIALPAAALALTGFYFVGFESHPGSYSAVPHPTIQAIVRTTLEAAGMTFGRASEHVWPFAGVALVVLMSLGAAALAVVWYQEPAERPRALGWFLFLGAAAGLAVCIGRGRASNVDYTGMAFEYRYMTLMLPAAYGLYFLGCVYRPMSLGRFAQAGLCVIMGTLAAVSTYDGLKYYEDRNRGDAGFMKDLRKGQPFYVLTRRYTRPLGYQLDQVEFENRLRMLHQAKMNFYRDIRENPTFKETVLPLSAARVEKMSWGKHEARGTGGEVHGTDAYLEFALSHPQYVGGIRLKVRYLDRPQPYSQPTPPFRDRWVETCPRLRLLWKTVAQKDFTPINWMENMLDRWQEERHLASSPEEQTLTIWVADTIDRFRIYPDYPIRLELASERVPNPPPDKPFRFVISEMVLLTPQEGKTAGKP